MFEVTKDGLGPDMLQIHDHVRERQCCQPAWQPLIPTFWYLQTIRETESDLTF